MTMAEVKTRLHERIEHLSDAQIKKLLNILNQEFPEGNASDGPPKERKLGTMKGEIWLAEDWDSDKTNKEIARSFHEGEIFPRND